jgi:uncharacterized OB-fold protein
MWKCHTTAKQQPVPDEDTLVFWEGCRRGRLLIQQCETCQSFRFPASPLCPECLGVRSTWRDDPGVGEVLTFCVYYSELAGQAWQAEIPYIVAVIRLQYSGVKIVSRLICNDVAVAQIGLGVRVVFAAVSEHLTLPQFVPQAVGDTGATQCKTVRS